MLGQAEAFPFEDQILELPWHEEKRLSGPFAGESSGPWHPAAGVGATWKRSCSLGSAGAGWASPGGCTCAREKASCVVEDFVDVEPSFGGARTDLLPWTCAARLPWGMEAFGAPLWEIVVAAVVVVVTWTWEVRVGSDGCLTYSVGLP